MRPRIETTSLSLKIIAIVSMVCDHTAVIFSIPDPAYSILRAFGRTAFLLFAFMIAEGFIHTHNIRRYGIRLLIFCFVSEIPFDLAFSHRWFAPGSQNVFFTLFLGLMALLASEKVSHWYMSVYRPMDYYYYMHPEQVTIDRAREQLNSDGISPQTDYAIPDRRPDRLFPDLADRNMILWTFPPVVVLAIAAYALHSDYGFGGVLLIYVFCLFRKNLPLQIISVLVICVLFYGPFELCGALAFLPLICYRGRKGNISLKYFFYVFYPAHLLLFWFLSHSL